LIAWWGKRPTLLAFIVLGSLVVIMALLAALTGFGHSYLPNFLLNAACDMLGALTVLFLIEPIIRRAATGISAHPSLSATRFAAQVAAATEIVRILDTASKMVRDDPENGGRLLHAIRRTVDGGACVKVLLMSPSSDASRAREGQLRDRHPDFDLDRMINRTITQIQRMKRELGERGDRIELRLYATPVPFILYGADSTLSYTTVPHDALVDDAPQVEVRAETELGRHLIEGFNALWDSARELDDLIKVRFAEQPGDVPMLMRHLEHDDAVYLASSRIDRVYDYQEEPRFLLGDDSNTVHHAVPLTLGTGLHVRLLDAFQDRYPGSGRRHDRQLYHMVKAEDTDRGDGRVLAFKGLPAVHLTSLIGVATHAIRILDTSSTLLLDDDRAPGEGVIFRALLDTLKQGASLKVLLMYPGTRFARLRAEEISRPHVESEIEQNLSWLTQLRKQVANSGLPEERVQVRLYNAPPSFSVYQVDDTVIAGFMPVGTRSSSTTHYSTELDSPLAGFVLDQFDLLWHRGPADHVHPLESLEFMTIEAPQHSIRILARAWEAGGEWFVCSTRVDDLLDQHGQDLPIAFDRWPERRWWLPKVLGKVEHNQARDRYVGRYGLILQDALIRQLVPLG
jgi:hypothetical protein